MKYCLGVCVLLYNIVVKYIEFLLIIKLCDTLRFISMHAINVLFI